MDVVSKMFHDAMRHYEVRLFTGDDQMKDERKCAVGTIDQIHLHIHPICHIYEWSD